MVSKILSKAQEASERVIVGAGHSAYKIGVDNSGLKSRDRKMKGGKRSPGV